MPSNLWDPVSVKQRTVRNAVGRLIDIGTIAVGITPDIAYETGFVPAYELVRRAPVKLREHLLQDFRFLRWVESTSQILHDVDLAELLDEPRWRQHLSAFGLFAAGVALNQHVPFTTMLILHEGPQVLPMTGKLIMGNGARGQHVTARFEPGFRVFLNGTRVDLAELTHLSGLELGADGTETRGAAEAGLCAIPRAEIDIDGWASLVADAFELIKQHPSSLAIVRSFVQGLVPVAVSDPGISLSTSARAFPGFVFLSASENPSDIAEALVHEGDHQLLYCLDPLSPLLKGGGKHEALLFQSPWREDPRPMEGIMFGASAFVRVGSFWSDLAGRANERAHNCIGKRATLALRQASAALAIIEQYADLTSAGFALIGELRSCAERALRDLGSNLAFADWSRSAQRLADEHSARWESRNGSGRKYLPRSGDTSDDT